MMYKPLYCKHLFQIYLNEDLHYKNGYTVDLEIAGTSGRGKWFSPKTNYVHVQHDITLSENSPISVIIKPKTQVL